MELEEFFSRRKKEAWKPKTELRYLQTIVDDLDEGVYQSGTLLCQIGNTPTAPKIRKWVENRRRVLLSRLSGEDIAYEITKGKSGGLTSEEKFRLKEKQVLHAIRAEIEETSCRVDEGPDIMSSKEEDDVSQLPPLGSPINRSQLARRIGVTTSYVSRILSGQRRPSLYILQALAGAWGVGIEDALDRIRAETKGGDSVQR